MGELNNNDHNMAELKYSSETFKAYIKWPDSNFYVGKQTVSYKIYLAWKKKKKVSFISMLLPNLSPPKYWQDIIFNFRFVIHGNQTLFKAHKTISAKSKAPLVEINNKKW